MNRKSFIALVAALLLSSFWGGNVRAAIPSGTLVKSLDSSSVYYITSEGNRLVFPNGKVYRSWFEDFDGVQIVGTDQLKEYPLRGSVSYRPGKRLLKLKSSPRVFAVDEKGKLRWIKTEKVAREIYGDEWDNYVDDLPEALFAEYELGEDVDESSGFDLESSEKIDSINLLETSGKVDAEKELSEEKEAEESVAEHEGSFEILDVELQGSPHLTAVITWKTSEPAASELFYSTTESASGTFQRYFNSRPKENHLAVLLGLNSDTTYHYYVQSTNKNGDIERSEMYSFTTFTPPGDRTSSGSSTPQSGWSSNLISDSGEYPSIASNGSGYGVVYGWEGSLKFVAVDSEGMAASEVTLATAPDYILGTGIVWDGTKYGVAWVQANPHNLRFATVSATGSVLSNIAVTVDDDNTRGQNPSVVWDGSNYRLAWSGEHLSGGSVYFSRIASNGEDFIVGKKKAVTSAESYGNNAVVSSVSSGENTGVTWLDVRDSGDINHRSTYFNVLDSNGDKLIQSDVKLSGGGRANSPNIFKDGLNYTVFWTESTGGDVNDNDVHVMKVDSNGEEVLAKKNLDTLSDNARRLSVTQTDAGYGLTWTSYPAQDIYFKTTDNDGDIVEDNELVSDISGTNDNADTTWLKGEQGIVWRNVLDNQSRLYFGEK